MNAATGAESHVDQRVQNWLQGAAWRGYGFAVAAALVAAVARHFIDPFVGDLLPYICFIPAIAFTAYLGGRGPALFAIAAGVLIANYFFIAPRYEMSFFAPSTWVGTTAFLIANLTVVFVTDRMRLERVRAEKFASVAEEERRRVAVEVAERTKKENELRASEQKFRAVLEAAGNAIYVHDGTRMIFVNTATETVTGYSREELLAHDIWSIVHPDFRDQVRANAQARFRGEPRPQRYEYQIVTKDGRDRWLDFSASLVEFEGRRCILATAFDVTERKQAEATLRKTEKLAATGRLAAAIAHEINNPLEAVTNLLYLIRTDPDNCVQYLQRAEQELERVSHLTKQTLGFYRESTHAEETRPAELLEEVISVYGSRLTHRRIEVEMKVDRSCTVIAHPGELRQVFSNLVANASDAMPEGGRLQLRLRRARDYRTDAPGVRITVADNGVGMEAAVKRCIYEPFFTTKAEVGMGLGMWVTRGIVDKHDGILRVRSRTKSPGRGTVFTLFLPHMSGRKASEASA